MSVIAGAAVRAGRAGRGLVPTGQLLTPAVWAQRHQGIVWLSGGVVEAHFHFFVMIGVITLYPPH